MVYHFDGHSLDAPRRELRRGGELVAVEPQVFDLLLVLVVHRDRVVRKDELLATVWSGRVVSDSTLSSRIALARQAVGDSGAHQRLIRTVARKGFRFVGAVQETAPPHGDSAAESARGLNRHAGSDGAPTVSAERRQLTILACGLALSTPRDAPPDPEDLVDAVAALADTVRAVVAPRGGTVLARATDGVLVLFGYPSALEDDAERAVRAGLAIANSTQRATGLLPRVGIATGLVVVGDVRGSSGDSCGLVGEAPQVAARLLAAAHAREVIVDDDTHRLVGGLFTCRGAGRSIAVALAPAKPAWTVRAENATDRFTALRAVRAPLIGRDEELALLLRRWSQAKAGEGRVVLVWGEPGIGKSRLIAALQDDLSAEPHARLRYFCAPHRSDTALHPVIAQLEAAAGFATADTNDLKLDKLERLLAASSGEPQLDLALIAELLSIETGARAAPLALSAQRRKELLLQRLVAQLEGLAAGGPVLAVLEDAHWIDPTSRELFDFIVERVANLPVLFVITYRPEFAPPWLGLAHVTTLTLSRLNRKDNAALVDQLAGGKRLPAGVRDEIVARTDGVPLFIEEVTRSILESGALREEDGVLTLAGPLPASIVPTTLQASLVARLDRLAPLRAIVQTGAALGREFDYATLKSVTGVADADLAAAMARLVDSGLVHQRGSVPNATFAFKHALVQDAAYQTMLKPQRAAMHRRIAEVCERDFPAMTALHPDVLAFHSAEGGRFEAAIQYSIKAARVALGRSAGVEAQAQVERAMRLLPRVEEGAVRRQLEGRLAVALGDALTMTQGFASPEVVSVLSRARALIDPAQHPGEALGALCGLFNYHLIRSESPQCLALAEPYLKGTHDRPTATVVHYLVGTAHLHLGDFARSVEHLEYALSSYDEADCRSVAFAAGYHLRSFTLIWLGLALLYSGSFARAAEMITAAVDDARRRAHPFTLVSALLALARFRSQTLDHAGAIAATEEGMAIAVEQRSPYHLSRAAILRALNVVDEGRFDEGILLMERALAAHRETGANFQSSYNLSRLAVAHARAGRLDRALELAEAAIGDVARTGERWWEAEAERTRGEILLQVSPPDRAGAQRCFTRALECARRQRARLWELQAAQSLARLWSEDGRRARARTLMAKACGAFDADLDSPNLRTAREVLARLSPG